MKAVLLSIQPQWCEKIASGEKTVEVRKNRPKIETPFKVYMYHTKTRNAGGGDWNHWGDCWQLPNGEFVNAGGKVIGEFVCDRVNYLNGYWLNGEDGLKETTCLSDAEIMDYIKYIDKTFSLWRIIDVKIYDNPKELGEFRKPCPFNEDCDILCPYAEGEYHGDGINGDVEFVGCGNRLTRPPKSWCYVEELV